MQLSGWVQLFAYVLLLAALTKPMGRYLMHVLDENGATPLDVIMKPLERCTYRLMGVAPGREQDWKQYTLAMLVFSLLGSLFTYVILRLQQVLPLNPQGFGPLTPHLAFNTAVSFATNTNWQSYSGETTLSYFSQMVGLALHNFTSAATGIAVAAAFVRGIARSAATTVGSFWVDLVRVTYYLLLPLCLVLAVFLVSQGTIQNFEPYVLAHTLDGGAAQTIAQGPMASQVAIKMLGTNGGGFMNANAAHPFENPTPLSNFVQMLSILAISSGLTWYLGRMTGDQEHGWAVWITMMSIFLAGVFFCWWAEACGNAIHQALGVSAADGNMEGKEVRFGVFGSALFAVVTTDASCGAVNAMHDSFTPLGGLVPLLNIELGEVIFGGVGSGLYGILVFVVLAVFIAGLMVGRTPEYLGKKIEAYEVKMAMLALLVLSIAILGFTALAAVSPRGLAGLGSRGPHGLSELIYAFSSAVGNNGSAFAGLDASSAWYNTALGLAMLIGRFFMIVPVLAMAGSLAQKKRTPASSGSFPVSGGTFVALLAGTIMLIGALNFLPVLALGPVVEHFLMGRGIVF